MSKQLLEIDGSFGEGGGQILRSSLALSLLTQRPFRLRNIRAGRERPGLRPQHLTSVQAAAAICQGQTRGASLESTDLVFEPGKVTPGDYRFNIRTAGATGLVLQTVYLPLALCGGDVSNLTFTGGTHVPSSPCFHFLDVTWRRYLESRGMHIMLQMRRAGFFPKGGGEITAQVQPCAGLSGLQLLERSTVHSVSGFSAVAGLQEHIAERQASRAVGGLKKAKLRATIRQETWPGGPGSVLAIVLETSPAPTLFFALGARGKPAEQVADEAVQQAVAYLNAAPAAVDAHSADQLVLPLAFAQGPSAFSVAEVTSHLLTNIQVIRLFLERNIACEGEPGRPGVVRIA